MIPLKEIIIVAILLIAQNLLFYRSFRKDGHTKTTAVMGVITWDIIIIIVAFLIEGI